MASYVLSLPDGAYAVAGSSIAGIESATTLTVLQRIKCDTLLAAISGNYCVTMWSIADASDAEEKIQAWVKNDSGLLAAKYNVSAGSDYLQSHDISALSNGTYVWLTWRFDPSHGTAWNRFAIRLDDGTVVASHQANIDNTAMNTAGSRGKVNLGKSIRFPLESGQVKAQTHDGFAIFNRAITATEEYNVPDPNGSGIVAWSFSDGSGSSIASDTTGAPSLTITGTPTWTSGGVWDASVAAATSYTFTGPTSGMVNDASTNFTVTPDGDAAGITVTPATDGAGSFTPSSVTFTGTSAKTFTYTPTSASGSPHTLSVSDDGGLTDPASIDYTVNTTPTGSFVGAVPNSEYLVASASASGIATATAITLLERIKADVLKNAITGDYCVTMFAVDDGAGSPEEKVQAWVKNDSGLLAAKIVLPGLTGALYLGSHSIASLTSADYVWLSWRYDPAHGTAWNRFAIRKDDGTVVASYQANLDNTAMNTAGGRGRVILGRSLRAAFESGLSKAQTWDGVAVFNRSITAAEEYAVPDPSGSGIIAWSFSDSTGDTVASDTAGAPHLTVHTAGQLSWTAGGIWNAPTTTGTAYTFTGPTTGVVNAASSNFTVTPNGDADGITVTPASDGAGSFTPSTVTFSGTAAATFTYTPTSTTGSPHTLSTTNDGALADPASIDFTVTDAPIPAGVLAALAEMGDL